MTERLKGQLFFVYALLSAILLAVATWMVFYIAPVEDVMGLTQKIFYLHVPSAMMMYCGVGICSLASLGFILTGRPRWDAVGQVGAELGGLACLIVLITGPIWAHRAWGAAWVWDPRLTAVAFLGLVLAAYHLVRMVGDDSPAARRLAALLGLLAAPNGYLIHSAVRMWGGQHPTVIYEGGGLDPTMRMVFVFCIVTAFAFFGLLLWWRLDLLVLESRATAHGMGQLAAAPPPGKPR